MSGNRVRACGHLHCSSVGEVPDLLPSFGPSSGAVEVQRGLEEVVKGSVFGTNGRTAQVRDTSVREGV